MFKLLFLIIGVFATQVYASGTDQYVQESRQAVKKLGGELKKTLKSSMKKSGPVASIEVCNIKAPEIASKISDERLTVARTALKVRNSSNKADAWEQGVLTEFERLKKSGEEVSKLEFSEITEHDGKKTFRYMKAIPTGQVCIACHGKDIAKPLAEKIGQLYPDDKATGFSNGDIRGAFTVTRKLP